MGFTFTTARRRGVHVILGLMGGTGSGKTYSALELATGLAQGKPFAVIDTEAGRSLHYADDFDFQHGDLSPPFTPDAYRDAIVAAESAGFPVVVVDSMSHEHAGDGGILEMHEAELDRIAGSDWKKRERAKFLAWVAPKTQHKKMVSRLLQLRTHLILCFRAEPKIKMQKVVKNGRETTEPADAGWQPICAKGLEYEMAASWMLRHERPGEVFAGTVDESDPIGAALKLPAPMRPIFQGRQMLNRDHGAAIARWASGTHTDFAAMVRDEFIRPGKLTAQEVNLALVDAEIKTADAPIPVDTDPGLVRRVLQDAVDTAPTAESDGGPTPDSWGDLERDVSEHGMADAVAEKFGPPGPSWELNRAEIEGMIRPERKP